LPVLALSVESVISLKSIDVRVNPY
jgi:hypothetical protein